MTKITAASNLADTSASEEAQARASEVEQLRAKGIVNEQRKASAGEQRSPPATTKKKKLFKVKGGVANVSTSGPSAVDQARAVQARKSPPANATL